MRAACAPAPTLSPPCRYTPAELKTAGFSAKVMELAGCTGEDMKAAGFGARELKECGLKVSLVFDLSELKAAGYKCAQAKRAGYRLNSQDWNNTLAKNRVDRRTTL